MDSYQEVALGFKIQAFKDIGICGCLDRCELKSIGHDIAGYMDSFCNTFCSKVFDSNPAGAEQQGRELIGYDAVDFFRHTAIETSQARFNVCNGDMELCCGKSACQCGIRIAID